MNFGLPFLSQPLQTFVSPHLFEVHYEEPSEYLWKKVKIKATHNRYFAEFAKLIQSVEEALAILASQAHEIMRLMSVYTKHMANPLEA